MVPRKYHLRWRDCKKRGVSRRNTPGSTPEVRNAGQKKKYATLTGGPKGREKNGEGKRERVLGGKRKGKTHGINKNWTPARGGEKDTFGEGLDHSLKDGKKNQKAKSKQPNQWEVTRWGGEKT